MCENICKAYSKVGDCMGQIKQLLYKYLDTDSIKLIGMCQKTEDVQWLIQNGYQKDFKAGKHGFKTEGEITDKGIKYFDKYSKEVEQLHKKTEKILTIENEKKTANMIRKYVSEHRGLNFSIESKLLDGLTENEKYAFLYFSQNPLDSGRR